MARQGLTAIVIVDNMPNSSTKRRRLTPYQLRQDALGAARRLLAEHGPASVTLQAVARELGMAHGNITHHFGSISNLHAAVVEELVGDLLETVKSAVADLRNGRIDERDVVDLVFDDFATSGAALLIAGLAAQRSANLSTIHMMLDGLSAELEASALKDAKSREQIATMVCSVIVPALGSALFGDGLAASLGLPSDYMRDRTSKELKQLRN